MSNKTKRIIIITSIFVIIIIIILIVSLLKRIKIENEVSTNAIGDKGLDVDYSSNNPQDVTEKNEYYTICNILNNYFKILNKNNSIYYIDNERDEKLQQEYLYDIIDKEYIRKNSIDKKNILEKIKIYNEDLIFVPVKLKVIEKEKINKYMAYGVIQDFDNNNIQDIYVYISLDKENKTYSIEPIYQDIKDVDNFEFENNNIEIEKNYNNTYQNQNITNEYIVTQYLNNYKRLVISKSELVYDLIDEEYKNIRFGSFQKYKSYIDNNIEYINKIRLEKYQVNNNSNYIEYKAVDQYNNEYIFIEDNNLNLKIKLDDYTIVTDDFKKAFDDTTEGQKVKIYIDKIFKMINNNDYENLYNYLYVDFRNKYFYNEQQFEKFLKDNLFRFNKVEFGTQRLEGSKIYSNVLKIKNIENSDSKNMNIIIKVEDNYNFKFSFSM